MTECRLCRESAFETTRFWLNGRAMGTLARRLSYEDVLGLIGVAASSAPLYSVTYTSSPHNGHLRPGDSVDLVQGMIINARITGVS